MQVLAYLHQHCQMDLKVAHCTMFLLVQQHSQLKPSYILLIARASVMLGHYLGPQSKKGPKNFELIIRY